MSAWKHSESFYDNLSLKEVLPEIGGPLKFPCYGAKLKGKGYHRYIEWKIFRSFFDPCHKASVLLPNIYEFKHN